MNQAKGRWLLGGQAASHSLEQTSQSWTDIAGLRGPPQSKTCRYSRAQGTSWCWTDMAGPRIHSQGLEEKPQKNKLLRCKKKSRLGICKRQEATREKERAKVTLSAGN